MTVRYIADMHFDHEDIIAYDNRPFDSAEEMNEELIRRWNTVVEKDDLTWILVDFCMGRGARWREILSALKGRKAMILGNHDNRLAAEEAQDLLESCADYQEMEDSGKKLVLCHYPIVSFRDHYTGALHLYGHVHTAYEWGVTQNAQRLLRRLYMRQDVCRMLNVGAMLPYMDYTPRSLEELLPLL